jgi:hypothetical protein
LQLCCRNGYLIFLLFQNIDLSIEFSQTLFILQQTTLLWMPYLFTQSMVTWHHFYHATGPTPPYLHSLIMPIQERAWTSTGEWFRFIYHCQTAWKITLIKPSAWWSQRVLWNLETRPWWYQTLI